MYDGGPAPSVLENQWRIAALRRYRAVDTNRTSQELPLYTQ